MIETNLIDVSLSAVQSLDFNPIRDWWRQLKVMIKQRNSKKSPRNRGYLSRGVKEKISED